MRYEVTCEIGGEICQNGVLFDMLERCPVTCVKEVSGEICY